MSEPKSTCPSCGVPYEDHLGLIGTCAEVRRLREVCREIQSIATRHERASDLKVYLLDDLRAIAKLTEAHTESKP